MKKIKNHNGFTLAEVLIAVAIIAIICAIAIPAIIRANKSLTDQQANDYAMSIYLAMQDELAGKRTDGSMKGLEGKYPSVYVDKEATQVALVGEIDTMLRGVVNKETGENLADKLIAMDTERQYVYLTTNKRSELEEIMPINSIDESLFDGKPTITVVFNEVTGDVLYVRYQYKDTYGEYDGGIVSASTDNIETIKPVVKIVNGQTCYVRIEIPVPDKLKADPSKKMDFLNGMVYTITVKDKNHQDNYFRYSFTGSDASVNCNGNNSQGKEDHKFEINTVTGIAKYVLDSLNPTNGDFATKAANAADKNGEIPAGSDILVEVQCTYQGKQLTPGYNTGNPLFSKLENGVITISNGRNLQNLNKISSDIAKTVTSVKIDDKAESIEWSETAAYYVDRIVPSSNDDDVLRFSPLTLDAFSGKSINFNGNNKAINDLYVLSNSGDAGMFLNLKGTVSNLQMNDPCIQTASGNAGAIAANSSGTISNCKVSVKSVGNPNAIVEGRGGYVGLIAGKVDGGTISGCTVDVDQIPASGTNFGLIAGRCVNSARISGTNASGSIKGGGANILGGAVGYTNGGTYSNNKASVNISGVKDVWGTGTTVDSFTPSGFGTAACPSGQGYAGKFVGFIYNGSFDTCTANGTDDKNLQFVGVVRTNRVNINSNNVYSSAKNVSGTFTVEQSTSDKTKYYNSQNYEFNHAQSYYTYDSTIGLSSCKFLYNADGKNYYQTLTTDAYYYDLKNTEHKQKYKFDDYTNDFSGDLNGKQYLITNSNGKYALCVKIVENDPTAQNYFVPPVQIGECMNSSSSHYHEKFYFDNNVAFSYSYSNSKVYDVDNKTYYYEDGYPETRAYLKSIGMDCDDEWYFYVYDKYNTMPNHNKNNHKLYLTEDTKKYGNVAFEKTTVYNGSGFSSDYPYDRSYIASGSVKNYSSQYYTTSTVQGYQSFTSYEISTIPIDMKNGTLTNADFRRLNALWESDEWEREQSNQEAILVKNSTAKATWVCQTLIDHDTTNQPVFLSLQYGVYASRGFDEIKDGRHARVYPAIRYVADFSTKQRSLYITKENGYLTIARDKTGKDSYLTINSNGVVGASSSVSSAEKLKAFVYDPVELKYDVNTLTNNGNVQRTLNKSLA